MSKVSRCYTPEERAVFLDLLKRHKDVVENKKIDGATLRAKEKSWIEITEHFNNAELTSQKRTVAQLKKWWSNLKQAQRESKTKENQARMGTGGGPEKPAPTLDPDVEVIAPHLMVTAPVHFSSNMSNEEFEQSITEATVLEFANVGIADFVIEGSQDEDSPAIISSDDAVEQNTPSAPSTSSPPSTSSAPSEIRAQEKQDAGQKTVYSRRKRQRLLSCSSSSSDSDPRSARIKAIMQHEEELHIAKMKFELDIMEEKRQHLKIIHDLEKRAMLAKAEQAEIELACAKKKFRIEE